VYRVPSPVPVAGRSQAWVCGRSFARFGVRIPPVSEMSVSYASNMLSGRGLYVDLITRRECDRVASIMRPLAP
jgi:hypothetical protein